MEVLRHFIYAWLMGLIHGDAHAERRAEFWLEQLRINEEVAIIAILVLWKQGEL